MLLGGAALEVVVEGMEDVDGEGAELSRRRFLLLVGSKLASQAKVGIPQIVVPRVVGPHGLK